MDENLWEKVEQFLYQLHYEETDREFHYESQAYKDAVVEKEKNSTDFQEVLKKLSGADSQAVKEYMQASDRCDYEEVQQAYVQGINDCMAILYGAGIVKISQSVYEFINDLNHQK